MSEDMRDSNRQRTDDLIRKLRKCGYTIRPSTKSPPEVITFSKEEIELMAIMEHERWMDEKKRKGWRYAPVKDEAAKKHPCIIDWEKLSDIEKDKDRKPLKVVAKLLADSGIEIVR